MGLVVIIAAIACYIGWHGSKAHMSHRGIPARRGQLRVFRRDRAHHAIWIAGTGALLLLALVIARLH